MKVSIIMGIITIMTIFTAGVTTATVQAQTTNPGLNDLLGAAQEIIDNPSGIPGQGPEQQYQIPGQSGQQQDQFGVPPSQQGQFGVPPQQQGSQGQGSWGSGPIPYVDQQWNPPQTPQGAFDKCTEMAQYSGIEPMQYCNEMAQLCAQAQFSFIECYATNMVPPQQVPFDIQQTVVQKLTAVGYGGQQQPQQGLQTGNGGYFPQ